MKAKCLLVTLKETWFPEMLERYQTEWESLRLVVERHPEYWQVFVYDFKNCEVLHTAERPSVDAAKFAALEFAAIHTFGPKHDLKPEVLAQMLMWEPY